MWTRAQLKDKGKFCFKRNYWKTVLVALFVSLILGGGFGSAANSGFKDGFETGYDTASQNDEIHDPEVEEALDIMEEQVFSNPAVLAATVSVGILVVLFAVAIGILVATFLTNPFDIGTKRFFVTNLNQLATVNEIGYGFDCNYKNIVKTMFFRDLYTFLWSLLFVIPGIVKAYEYRMIPYLLADHPDMTMEEAFARSKEMMSGQKWRAFVLDLSFIGWYILSAFTFGILAIFYVSPYKHMTDAALYEALKNGGILPEYAQYQQFEG